MTDTQPLTITPRTQVEYDDGEAISELVWNGDNGRLLGAIWRDEPGLGWYYRAHNPTTQGYWLRDVHNADNRTAAIAGLIVEVNHAG